MATDITCMYNDISANPIWAFAQGMNKKYIQQINK